MTRLQQQALEVLEAARTNGRGFQTHSTQELREIVLDSTNAELEMMIDDVNIYGGFPTGGGPRNPGIYQTILSGDIDNDDNPTYNSYHVVKCEDINNAILDGFTITGGNAYASSEPNYFGGGIYIYKSSPTIKD